MSTFTRELTELAARYLSETKGREINAQDLWMNEPWHKIVGWAHDAKAYYEIGRFYRRIENAPPGSKDLQTVFTREPGKTIEWRWTDGQWKQFQYSLDEWFK